MKINTQVVTDIDVNKILERRGLGPSDKAERFLASEVKRLSEPYTPRQQGTLYNESQVVGEYDGIYLIYDQPYAEYQYEGVSGSGKPLNYHGGPMRGKQWDKRMMADRGEEVRQSFANYIGGKVK